MKVDKEIVDITILEEGFSYSALWTLKEELEHVIFNLENARDYGIILGYDEDIKTIDSQLFFCKTNLAIVELVMVRKRGEVFEKTNFAEICFN